MASQGEREPGGLIMCSVVGRPMVQDIPEQDIMVVQDELSPTNSEPEMGAAAAASDTPPPLLRQSPSPAPSKTATDRGDSASSEAAEFCRLGERLRGMMQQMMDNMDARTQAFKSDMRALRGETRQMG